MDSIHIPMIMSALKEIEKDKNADIEKKFEDSVEKFKQKMNYQNQNLTVSLLQI